MGTVLDSVPRSGHFRGCLSLRRCTSTIYYGCPPKSVGEKKSLRISLSICLIPFSWFATSLDDPGVSASWRVGVKEGTTSYFINDGEELARLD